MMPTLRRQLVAIALLASTTALGACRAQPASDVELAETEQPVEQVLDEASPAPDDPAETEAEPARPTAAFTTSTAAALDDEPKEGAIVAVPQQRDVRVLPRTMATPSRNVLTPRSLDTNRLQNSSMQLRTQPAIRPVGSAASQQGGSSNTVRALEATPR